MNKTGKGQGVIWVAVLGIFLVGGLLTYAIFGTTLFGTAVTSEENLAQVEETAVAVSSGFKAGDPVTMKIKVEDITSNSITQLGGLRYYCWKNGKTSDILNGASGSLSDASATSTVPSVNVGDEVTCVAGNSTVTTNRGYYGKPVTFSIDRSDTFSVPAYRQTQSLKPTIYNSDGDALNELQTNLTLGTSDEKYWNKLKVELNESQSAFFLAAIGFDVEANTNTTSVDVSGVGTAHSKVLGRGTYSLKKGSAPQRLNNALNYIFYFSQPEADFNKLGNDWVLLREYEYIETGAIVVKTDGDGTPTEGEDGILYLMDSGIYQSVASADRSQVKYNTEDNAPTPADVGAGDFRLAFSFQ